VCPRQIAEAHEEFDHDLSAGKAKGPPEELRPRLDRARMMRVQPIGERPVRSAQRLNPRRIFDRRVDLGPTSNPA